MKNNIIFTNFKLFVEARLSDIASLKQLSTGDKDTAFQIKKEIERDFEIERELIKYITLKKRDNTNKKIRVKIKYNDTATHSLKQRLKERTSIKSISEFNTALEQVLNIILPDSIGGEIKTTDRYAITFQEQNFVIIFHINPIKYDEITVITILPNTNRVLDVKYNFFM